ncbi:MAG: BlaI/MecI/CopY family transcriptional regulator [Nitrososphaerota archaeon]|jgi:predicted transcriptional regulator|nr:BlaI/MecI/CopY family transcriptional regulator [Nitrososphaerota archaeon]MDG6927356.1 BlaI/MecI/CopY family transcriptional regulator [Nitrososphaerota archaeon]MDG6930916.1 BlaI/MecI/CopY family transcriptional regulator [Nitrososphaerota archaeon]MDG6932216.1 BlaI/MecI/CopY family transcriptional regulator [Nitrososphaerota archaeon]MDG6935791.1 BlaI/MecI/CopY family transcriptional regulator [Nitrososphaerota archaeon]
MKKKGIGPLELKVLSAVSELENGNIRDIYAKLSSEEDVALTTVATVLDRLYRKGLLSRKLVSDGRPSYIYSISGNAFEDNIMLTDFIKAFKRPLMAYFASNTTMSEEEIKKLLNKLAGD